MNGTKEVMLEDCIRFASDVYFPEVNKLYPEIRETNKRNTPINGFYPESILKEIHGWTRVIETDPDPTGFFAALYAPPNEKKLQKINTGIIAFRGSDDIYDFLHHDLRIADNKWPQAFERKNAAKTNMQNFEKNNPFETFGDSFKEKIVGLIKNTDLYDKDYCKKTWA